MKAAIVVLSDPEIYSYEEAFRTDCLTLLPLPTTLNLQWGRDGAISGAGTRWIGELTKKPDHPATSCLKR